LPPRINVIRGLGIALAAASCAALWAGVSARSDEPSPDTIGAIEGDAISVQGPMTVEVVRGQAKTILRSGSDIRVKSGQARIDLVEGGQVAVCGPAHLSVLKSGGSLTLALDSGSIHAFIEHGPALTVYTAQIVAKPISISGGPQDTLVGFDTPATMCIRATSGAVHLEQQFTGQNLIVPQGGDILIPDGRFESLRNAGGHCSCELQLAKVAPPPPEISRPAPREEIREREVAAAAAPRPAEKAPAKEEPVYQVFMPPLSYDANAKVQREFDPQFIVFVRRVRVRPTLIFQGRVEGPLVAQSAPSAEPAKPAASAPAATPTGDSLVDRVRAFFHRLFS
jgi:hypothetical protein